VLSDEIQGCGHLSLCELLGDAWEDFLGGCDLLCFEAELGAAERELTESFVWDDELFEVGEQEFSACCLLSVHDI
jgi:hypothetical protein